MPAKNLASSVRNRLLALSKERGRDFNAVLWRYGTERLLYRISRSAWADQVTVKGAMLYAYWGDEERRPTRDLDLRATGSNEPEAWRQRFEEALARTIEQDGLEFGTVRAEIISEDQKYPGVRIKVEATLAQARIALQIDIGVGDVMVPAPVEQELPCLLEGFPAPRLRRYAEETYVAEKFEAIVDLGTTTSRMKDFWDLHHVLRTFRLEASKLRRALEATFQHRGTALPQETPPVLTAEFWDDLQKQQQWRGFYRRTFKTVPPEEMSLARVCQLVAGFLMPVSRDEASGTWEPGGPWKAT